MNYLEKKKKAMLNYVSGGRLPSEYQEVEWIGSSGTQYIDIDIVPNMNTKLEIDYEPTQTSGVATQTISASGTGSSNYFGIGTQQKNVVMYYMGYPMVSNVFTQGDRIQVSLESVTNIGYLEIYNVNTQQTYTNSKNGTFTSTTPLSIFCFHFGNQRLEKATAKLYSYKITQDGDLVFNGIPCYRKSDTEIGLYDLVTQTFYTNSGSGTFTKGQDV